MTNKGRPSFACCYRFEMSNHLWRLGLKPAELLILSVICYHAAHRRGQRMDARSVAAMADLSVRTVKKHLAELIRRGLVTEDLKLTHVTERKNHGGFFSLPNEIFTLELPPSAFAVYAYLLYREERRTCQCSPSLRTIAAATRLSKGTVVKAVDWLYEKRLIAIEETRYYNEQGMCRKGNNRYTILPIQAVISANHQCRLEERTRKAKAQRKLERLMRSSKVLQVERPA